MESFGTTFSNEEWESLRIMFSGDDQDTDHHHFSAANNTLFSSDHHGLNFETPPSISLMDEEVNINGNSSSFTEDHGFFSYFSENSNPNLYQYYFSQETSNNNGYVAAHDDGATSLCYPPSSNMIPLPADGVVYDRHGPAANVYNENNNVNSSSLLAQVLSDYSSIEEEILCMRDDVNTENSVVPKADQLKHASAKRKIEMLDLSLDAPVENQVNVQEFPKKKARVSKDNKNKKKVVQPKKKQKIMEANENENNAVEDTNNNKGVVGNVPIASSSSCSSEDDLNGGTVNSNWKTRAGRGAATDPQSLYARKRRERINERLKVLQNLVPNGTKVDISTMLEEAVQYVKFLQLQIKLLSSDKMWMYAPIAYNGMDMGLYQKLQQS